MPLRLGKPKAQGGPQAVTSAVGTGVKELGLNGTEVNGNGKRTNCAADLPKGVGLVDFSDDLDAPIELEDGMDDDEDDLIDEDELLTEEDLARPIMQRESFALSNFQPAISRAF